MLKGLFITGTDTGVGKTVVTGGLARILKNQGITPGVMKPVETGCKKQKGRRIPRDGSFLKFMAGAGEPLEEIVPYRLLAPLAPYVAAEKEKINLEIPKIHRLYRQISSRYSVTLVEGAGGILVPVTRKHFMIDIIAKLNLPVLLVSRLGLGTLNHTLLTLACLKQRQIPVIGIILNDSDDCRDQAAHSNPSILQQLSPVPVLGIIPYDKGLQPSRAKGRQIAESVARHITLEKLLSPLYHNRG